MLLDLSCPIELVGYDLTHDERGVRGFVRLFNLSDRPVRGFEAVITWRSAGGALDIPLGAGAVFAAPHAEFALPIETGPTPTGELSALHIVRVDFGSAPPWLGDPGRLIDIKTPGAPSERELNALRRVAGPDAIVRPLSARAYWVCACGRANARGARACARCGRSRRDCLTLARQLAEVYGAPEAPQAPGEAAGQPSSPDRKSPPESPAFSHKALRARYLRQRSQLIRRTVTMLTAALLIALTALLWVWLSDMQQRARDMVPPTKIEETGGTPGALPPGKGLPPRYSSFFSSSRRFRISCSKPSSPGS